jgi:phenylpropionate dioxygenase-like ring-hydroxylating dioxygenase large terminal subunit
MGHRSVVRLERRWFPVCTSGALRDRPVARRLQGVPLVLFRGADGAPAALLDRCPHRNVPLSLGRCAGGELTCAYHGWRFDAAGACRAVPGLFEEGEVPAGAEARAATRFATREQDGLVWAASTPGPAPEDEPFRFPLLDAPGYTTVRWDRRLSGSMHAAVENALDVPHTAFLHGGLFRTSRQVNLLDVEVRRGVDRVEAEYLGEPVPRGLLGKLLAPGGGTVGHVDRFILPCVAQVEYRLGDRSHLVVTTAFTPVSDDETHLFSAVSVRLPVPALVMQALVRPLLLPLSLRVLAQDATILKAQAEAIARFDGEQFVHTEADVLGPAIWHLLRQAERGLPGQTPAVERRRLRT